ncbi:MULTISPECIES: PRC-barrel domain-containing protein [Kordiimonas]|jgi:sporulation protein YlmC with PRC-barrel domain|uniref:PRC-barrel domain-containing protein n=1 Tax=Kordiimonas TaxID=288021 RepID=UPI002580EBCF|nr:PRC-barrel domain-containing protein [Kordiimonas sp. UBA4487]
MSHSLRILAGAGVITAALSTPTWSQMMPEPLQVSVDQKQLASGDRTSKTIGRSVANEKGDVIGTIDDLIITSLERELFAVLSIGGFMGMGTTYVAVPYSQFTVKDHKMILNGATKKSLQELPEFEYSG